MSRETSDNLDDLLMDDEPIADEPMGDDQQEDIATGDNTEGAEPPSDATQQADQQNDEGPHVPRKALEDERRKRQELDRKLREYEARFQQQQQPQPQQYYPQQPQQYQPQTGFQNYQQGMEPPDPFIDPVGAFEYQQQMFDQRFNAFVAETQRRDYERGIARSQRELAEKLPDYDELVVLGAEAAKQNPNLLMQITSSDLPGLVAYEEGKRIKALQTFGSDPDAYKAKLKAEIMAEMGLAGSEPEADHQQTNQPNKSPVPKSLATTPSSRPRNTKGQFVEASLEDILDD